MNRPPTTRARTRPLRARDIALAAVAAAALCAPRPAHAYWMQQTIPLKEGWNAIHVKVNPFDYACDAAFGGGGIEQATWWNRDRRSDGSSKDTTTTDTFAWYSGEAMPSTFGAVLGDERYLVKAVAATNLVLVGTPALPRGKVFLGEPNLLGLNVPASGVATCGDYFAAIGEGRLAATPFYAVKADNTPIMQKASAALANPSQAFWVKTSGSGEIVYKGPLDVSVDTGANVVEWTTSTAAREIVVRNNASTERTLTFGLEPSLTPPAGQGAKAGDIKLKVERIDWTQGYARRVYETLAFPFTTNVAAGATFTLRVRPDVAALPATSSGDYLGILTVSDAGSAALDAELRAAGTCLYRVGLKSAGGLAGAKSPAGLWVGSVALTGVNRAQMLTSAASEWDAETLRETTQAFSFRLILHASDDGTVRLLKQAFVGTDTADDATAAILADRETAKAYRKTHPDATIRRVASANFPFMEPLVLANGASGFLTGGASLTATFTQFADAKDNPFLHQFHPNHDGLAFNNGKPTRKTDGADGTGDYESWSVTRAVTLTFADADPIGANDDWNKTVCGGVYREVITGLNKTPVIVEGAFRLNKTLDTATLQSGGVGL